MDDISKILSQRQIESRLVDDVVEFSVFGIDCFISKNNEFYVDKAFFGKLPHVMLDGKLCINGNISVEFQEMNKNSIEIILDEIFPWLISLDPELKVAEFLMEIEYYLINLVRSKDVIFETDVKNFHESIYIKNPIDLFEIIYNLEDNLWYNLMPINYQQFNISIKRDLSKNVFYVCKNEKSKASQRVLGLNYRLFEKKVAFIGFGSVNSYIFKKMISHGCNDFVLIDNDRIEKGNIFRHAFSYEKCLKIEAGRRFAHFYDKTIKLKKKNCLINEKSVNFIFDREIIIVSVDNPLSWVEILRYIQSYASLNSIIVLVGIDAFGNYAKFEFVKSIENRGLFYNKMLNFLKYIGKGTRKSMIGNGCGKSLAIYSERTILMLAEEVFDYLVNSGSFDVIREINYENAYK